MWIEPDSANLLIVSAQPEQLTRELACSGYPALLEVLALDEIDNIAAGFKVPANTACLIADIRCTQQSLLNNLALLDVKLPTLALSDNTTSFAAGYPFGCDVMGLVHIDEFLGSETLLLQRRIAEAVRLFQAPISLGIPGNPVTHAFQQVVDNSSDWFIVKDLQHRFVIVPERFSDLKNMALEDIIGKNDLEIGSSEYDVFGDEETGWQGFWKQDDAVTSTGEITIEDSSEWKHINPAAHCKFTQRVPLRNRQGDIYGLLVCVKDISEQVHKEKLLSERTEMLEQMTIEKQRSEHHQKTAEAAVAAKNRFLAAASHDLRQPLHAMGLFLDVLESRLSGGEELQLMGKLKESTSALYTMFSSLLDISRLDAGVVQPELAHTNMLELCSALQNEFHQHAVSKGLEFHCNIDACHVHTDATMCARIVRNLLRNALENTWTGSVTLNVKTLENAVRVEIIDTGCGIESENLANIFKEYFPNKTKGGEGRIGLGLAIVERMCDLLEIAIGVSSEPGKGSVFTLTLPKGDVSQWQAPVTGKLQQLSGNIRVLVLDDEETILEGTRSVLDLNGCKTMVASSTDRAFEVLAGSDSLPDIIVADYELGSRETGVAAISQIRHETGQRIPAILVTGDTSYARQCDARDHGLTILHKPIESAALLQAIRKLHDA